METVVVDGGPREPAYASVGVPWGSIFAGAIVAAAVSGVLLSFGSAIGLSVVSSSPTWRDTSFILAIVSGLYLVFVALSAFGFGGYIAGRLAREWPTHIAGERPLRDGLSGLLSWGLAVLLAGFIAVGVAGSTGAGVLAASTATASAGEGILSYELDRLLRTDQHVGDADWAYRRAEAARILLTAGGHNGVSGEDRAYLTALVAGVTKIPQVDAEVRSNRAIADAHTAIGNARKAAILEAFMIGAALLLGAAIAWFAAEEGGRERDARVLPTWNWRLRHPFVRVGDATPSQ